MCKRLIKWLCLLVITISPVLSGCVGGSREVNEVSFVIAMAFDAAPDGQLYVSYQIGRAATAGADSPEKQQTSASQVITVRAATLSDVRNLLNSLTGPRSNLSHVKVMVFSEELARRGLKSILPPTVRWREWRGSIFIIVTKGSAKEFLKANKPEPFIPSKFYELAMASSRESAYYPISQLHDFYIETKGYSGEAFAAYAAINPETLASKGPKLPGTKFEIYKAGDFPREGGNPIEFAGTALFRGGKMVGILTNHETHGLLILRGTFPHSGFLTSIDPLQPKDGVNSNIGLREKPHIKARLVDGQAVFDIHVDLEGEVSGMSGAINYEVEPYRSILEASIAQIYKDKIEQYLRKTQELDCDAAGLGYYLRPHFKTMQEFKDFDWSNKYRYAEFHVTVTVNIRRFGLMWRTAPIVN